MPHLVHVNNISLILSGASGTVPILSKISLLVEPNCTLAITGPSGSGKTSLLMLIAGLESSTSGTIEVCGQPVTGRSEDELAALRAKHIGIVFQSFHLIPTMTALENVTIPLEFARQDKARERAAEALQRLGLGHRMAHYPAQLSGGEQQRVAIARAFVMRPALLLADEPTGNLDHETGEKVIELLFDLRRESGTTLLLVTHDASLAARCDRIVHISDGRLTDGDAVAGQAA